MSSRAFETLDYLDLFFNEYTVPYYSTCYIFHKNTHYATDLKTLQSKDIINFTIYICRKCDS